MEKKRWEVRSFAKKELEAFNCPKCRKGMLKLFQFNRELTGYGKIMESDGDPTGLEARFAGLLKCSVMSCEEIVAFGGICKVDQEEQVWVPDGYIDTAYYTTYFPKFFVPNLELFELSSKVSAQVRLKVNAAFSHYWSDLSASANKIRTAVELILNDANAAKKKRSKAGVLKPFSNLHQRIEHFANRNKSLADLLMANKIIGNEGSHVGSVSVGDILDAFEILDIVLDIVYIKKREKAIKIAQEINQLNKPRSKKR